MVMGREFLEEAGEIKDMRIEDWLDFILDVALVVYWEGVLEMERLFWNRKKRKSLGSVQDLIVFLFKFFEKMEKLWRFI